jgi:hypothetical protein
MINWAKLAVAVGIFLEIVSPAIPDSAPLSLRTLTAAVGAALMIAGVYEGAPAPHQIPGSTPAAAPPR